MTSAFRAPSPRAHGGWLSPIGPDTLAAAAVGLSQPAIDGSDVYWIESRPAEAGRSVLVRRDRAGTVADVVPPGFSVRTRAHEYGGGAYAVDGGDAYFSNDQDGRMYRIARGGEPRPITPEGPYRYADLVVDRGRHRVLCVRESHPDRASPRNEIVAVDARGEGEPRVLAAGHDFFASIRPTRDGSQLAWLSWNHPDMPWDETTLWVAAVDETGAPSRPRPAAGGRGVSIFQPEWGPDGELWYVSDGTGWWNLFRGERAALPILSMDAEFGRPQWAFGLATYGFATADRVVCAYTRDGCWHMGVLDVAAERFTPQPLDVATIFDLRAADGRVVAITASTASAASVVEIDFASETVSPIRSSTDIRLADGDRSSPRAMSFPTTGGALTHAFYYPPANACWIGLPRERPPLIVRGHGGPTSSASAGLNLEIQFWTSRGFAVADVNYAGSTGYGRAYRERLNGAWGVADVDDFVATARQLADAGLADPRRLIVRGGSAAGFTALCALVRYDIFAAAGIYYGVSDLAALAEDTHKFEARYLDRLVAPYPGRSDVYRARSPQLAAARIRCPVIFFQGLDDRVVPPEQTTTMADAIRANGVPVEVHLYAGESHGFRRAETVRAALAAELAFYRRVLGIESD